MRHLPTCIFELLLFPPRPPNDYHHHHHHHHRVEALSVAFHLTRCTAPRGELNNYDTTGIREKLPRIPFPSNSFTLLSFFDRRYLRRTSSPRGDNRDPFFLQYHRCDPLFVFRRNYNSIARLDCPVSTDSPLIIRLPRTLSVSVRDRLYRFETRIYSAV